MKLFLKACGIPDLLRLTVEDRNRSDSFPTAFHRPYVLIGRNSDADLTLDHWQVSRRHTYLQLMDDRLYCLDLGSRTGTHWEGRPSRSRWLALRQTIHVGPYRIRVESREAGHRHDDDLIEMPPPTTEELPGFSLETIGDLALPDWRMEDAIALLGRGAGCQLQLAAETNISRYHASLVRTRMGVWLVDLLGTGGITVNRTKLGCSQLKHGDEIVVGQRRFRVRYDDPEAIAEFQDEPVESLETSLVVAPRHLLHSLSVQSLPVELRIATESAMLIQTMLAPMMNQFMMMQQQMFENFHQTMMVMVQSMQMIHQDRMDLIQADLAEVRRLTAELHALQIEAARVPPGESVSNLPLNPPPADPPPAASSPTAKPVGTGGRAKDVVESQGNSRPIPTKSYADVHTMLNQKIANIQSERQSRWQRILGMVGGGAGERA